MPEPKPTRKYDGARNNEQPHRHAGANKLTTVATLKYRVGRAVAAVEYQGKPGPNAQDARCVDGQAIGTPPEKCWNQRPRHKPRGSGDSDMVIRNSIGAGEPEQWENDIDVLCARERRCERVPKLVCCER